MKKTTLDNKEAFGALISKKFSIGELVQWKGWYLDNNGDTQTEVFQGVLLDIFVDSVGGRDVMYGKVLPLKNNHIFEINMMILKKVNK